jgi:amino acid adenylation domain-containing protein
MSSEITTIRELIDRMALTHPEGAFLISPETGRTLTFQGLQEQSRLLSARLFEAGLEQGDKVAFLLDNGLFTAELFLGTMYGGLVSVPLNVRAGVSQLAFTLDHSDAKVVFVGEAYGAMLKEIMAHVRRAVEVISIGADGWAVSGKTPSPAKELGQVKSEDAALLMYTSGSTGQPRAGVHTHATVLAHGRNSVCSHQLTAADRSLLVLPMYHINAECVTLVPTLMSGGSVVVPAHFAVNQFWDWLDDYHCTWSALVPTIISQLLDWKDPKAASRQAAFARIRFLRSSSAPLSPSLHREFLDKFKLPLIQAMGCTEGGNVFSNPVPPGVNKIGSPGLPWGFEARIVNREGTDLPTGEPGEVLLRGPAMMKGYYKDPVATAAALDSEGWLHTGDLAYRDEDGYFFVVGRSKELIIKGGMNIAPKQIDEVLESHPAVKEAAAVGVPDRYVGEDLVAFVVFRAGKSCEERELLSFCESRLGHFKTPTRIHFVQDLPKGPSGKVQRLRLVEEAARPAVARTVSLESGTSQPALKISDESIEAAIAGTWAELLAQPKIDAAANFFALGGHSLLAIQCISRLREKVPVMLSLSDFFENATVAEQAALVRKRMVSAPAPESGERGPIQVYSQPIPPRDRTLPCPLSPAQKRVWFFKQLAPDVPLYNESEAVGLKGELNVDALERALNVVVTRHEILRSTIHDINGQPVAVVLENWPLKLKRVDLGGMVPAQRKMEVERLLIDEPRRPYELETEPGIRATLLRLGPQEHVLILLMHHLVCDWSSEGVLWREMSAAYRAYCRGEPLELAPLPIQHGDYAAWQQQHLTETTFANDLAFWEENLRGAPELLELPTDRPRPPAISYRGARQRFRIAPSLAGALRECSRREKVSLFTVFTAALDALFHRYTGQEDILLGIPLSDRERPEMQSMIGFLLHTQVLRTRLTGDMTFGQLLAPVQKGVLDLYSHSAVPFDQVVSKLRPKRNLSYSPLFQVMINWRDRDQLLSFIGMEKLEVESLLAESRTSKFDLTVMLTDGGDEIWMEMEYNTDLFDDARIERMAGHYQTLLEAVAANPDRRIAELPLLTEAERHKLLVEWNNTSVDFQDKRCVHQLVEAQAQLTPDGMAVVLDGRQLTYRELDARANQLARHLHSLGVGPESLVGLCVERSLEMVIGLLGILKAGGAYVPLDPTYPKERLAFMLEDSAAPVLLTQASLAQMFPTQQTRMVRLDSDWGQIAREADTAILSGVTSQHPAYVIYTSGSTGKPKGVMIPHQAAVNFLRSMREAPGLTAQDTMLAITTLCFDIAGLELWLPLSVGARIVIAKRETTMDGQALAAMLDECEATMMQATPSTWRMLLTSGWKGNPRLRILCGGEPWPRELARQLLERCESLWNMYGPTETTIWSAACKVSQGEDVLIGSPIANTQLYVVDRNLQPVPVGVAGELCIGGDGLARGYLKRPELTAEKFPPDPFSGKPGARIYKTGDLVRFKGDGKIEFLGRMDHQVKIRGFRIEIGEIEAALNRHPGVKTAAVTARDDSAGGKRLVAYVAPKHDHDGMDDPKSAGGKLISSLRDWLKSKMPEYMVPSDFVLLEAMPLTPNGKIDRKALPAPDLVRAESSSSYVAPRSPTEQLLSEIWARELGLEKAGVNDNFFDIGGHSLLLVRVQASLCKALNAKVSIVEMFQYPTIRSLASHLDQPSAKPERLQKVQERTQRRAEALGHRRQKRERQP